MLEDQGRETAAAAASWWLDVLGTSDSPPLCAATFTQHFVAAALAEWRRQEQDRPGSWPEDQHIKITFCHRPGFFLSIVFCALLGHAEVGVRGLDAAMTLAATGYRVERWQADQKRYVQVEAKGTL